jgi:hypothetical protein
MYLKPPKTTWYHYFGFLSFFNLKIKDILVNIYAWAKIFEVMNKTFQI